MDRNTRRRPGKPQPKARALQSSSKRAARTRTMPPAGSSPRRAAPRGSVNAWEDDPLEGTIVQRPVPSLTAGKLKYRFGGPAVRPGCGRRARPRRRHRHRGRRDRARPRARSRPRRVRADQGRRAPAAARRARSRRPGRARGVARHLVLRPRPPAARRRGGPAHRAQVTCFSQVVRNRATSGTPRGVATLPG